MARPELFNEVELAVPHGDRRARVFDWFGTVSWTVDGESLAQYAWSAVDGRVLAWQRGDLRIELALIQLRPPLAPQLPAGMEVDQLWLGVWRLQSTTPVLLPRLTCELSEGREGLDGGPSTGEHLDAQTWEDGARRLSIGTQDIEVLCWRAEDGRELPTAWAEIFERFADRYHPGRIREFFDGLRRRHGERDRIDARYPTSFIPFGIASDLPMLPPDELCQVHHVAAWQIVGVGEKISTWFAVDLDASPIIDAWAQLPSP